MFNSSDYRKEEWLSIFLILIFVVTLGSCEQESDPPVNEILDMTIDQSLSTLMEMGLDLDVDISYDEEMSVSDKGVPDMLPVDFMLDLGPDTGINPEFVMSEIELLSPEEGFDLDGDGIPDNGLALLFADQVVGQVLGGDPDEYIARTVRRGVIWNV